MIPEITPANYPSLAPFIAGAAGVDVTGGMNTKVQDMLKLVRSLPEITVHILDGTQPDLLQQILNAERIPIGTTIRSD